jgi:hypothetical protein
MRFVLFSLCSAVTEQLLGSRKQSLQRALNSGPGSILPPDGILARYTMTCIRCKHNTAYKFGTCGKLKVQRHRCQSCKATTAGAPEKTLGITY